MCTGVEPLLLQGFGAGMTAVSAHQGSKANKAAFNAQAQIANNNAQLAQYQSEDAITRSQTAASDAGLKAHQLKGTQRAALAHSGVDLSFGSAAEILTDTDYFGEIDRARIIDSGAREAWGYRSQASGFEGNAALLRSRADAESPLLSAGTSLLGSAGRVAASWYGSSAARPPAARASFGGVDYQKRGDY